jgi:tungstate transport system permease protein
VSFLWEGLREALQLIWHHDPFLVHLLVVTLKVTAVSTGAGLAIGLPLGLWLGLGRFPGRNVLVALANAGLGLPPVVVGLFLLMLMLPRAPLGRFQFAYTLHGVYIAQACLALPVMVALTVSAVRDISPGLLDQARALGANRRQIAGLATRESRIGILAATIATVGSSLSEVGAVVLVGGNVVGATQTLASASLENANAGRYADGIAIGILLLALIAFVSGLLTWVQYGRGTAAGIRALR